MQDLGPRTGQQFAVDIRIRQLRDLAACVHGFTAFSRFRLALRDPLVCASYSRNNPCALRDYIGMKHVFIVTVLALSSFCAAEGQEIPPKHEIGLTLGGLLTSERNGGPAHLDLRSGVAFQANYGYRLWSGDKAALYGEVHLLANPLRDVRSADPALTRNVATLFVTPGIRLKFRPTGSIAPYVAVGGGWADYEQSTMTIAGTPNPAPRTVNHGAFDYGGGVDFKFWRFIGLRAEVRDFYAGGPAYNTTSLRGGQHNVVVSGGLVLKVR